MQIFSNTVFTGIIARAIIKISMSEILQKLAKNVVKWNFLSFFKTLWMRAIIKKMTENTCQVTKTCNNYKNMVQMMVPNRIWMEYIHQKHGLLKRKQTTTSNDVFLCHKRDLCSISNFKCKIAYTSRVTAH